MPVGNKRAAEESSGHEATRASKAVKTSKNGEASSGKGGSKNGTKAASTKPKLSASEFKEKALPLHVNLTHTPPTILKEGVIEEDGTEQKTPEEEADDVGLIGSVTLVPSSFSTGSYGWKGSRRVTVELQGAEAEDGTREKVQVMLTINATVLGSKPEKEGGKETQQSKQDDIEAEPASVEEESEDHA